MDVDAIIKGLSEAQKVEIMAMSENWANPFNGLVGSWLYRQHPEVCERRIYRGRTTYGVSKMMAAHRLTETGLAVRARLLEEGK